MLFNDIKCAVKKYVVATTWFAVAMLPGCSDNKHENSFSSSSPSSSSLSSASSSNSSASSSSALSSTYSGQWYAPAYGYVLSVSVENNFYKVETYSVTKNYCLLQNVADAVPLDKLQQDYIYLNHTQETLLKSKGGDTPGVEYRKLEKLPDICEKNLQKLKIDSGYAFDAKKDFEILWQTFSELYINFELRKVSWDDVYEDARKSVENIQNEVELFEFLSALISPLGDGHAVLLRAPLTQNLDASLDAALANDETDIFSTSTQLSLTQKLLNEYTQILKSDGELHGELTDTQEAAAEDYISDNVNQLRDIILGYVDESFDIKVKAAGEVSWFKTHDNIGYLHIGAMGGYGETGITIAAEVAITDAIMSEVLKDLGETRGLIIDVRFNPGGDDNISLAFVRHFMNKPQVMYSKFSGSGIGATPAKDIFLNPQSKNIYIKPTAVLVSGDTASAAEIFTLAMRSLPHVAIIGEQTAGEFSDILVKRLTSDIAFGVSNETYLDTEGNNYERVGIPADVVVPFATLDERKGGYDAGLNTAIEWIKNAE